MSILTEIGFAGVEITGVAIIVPSVEKKGSLYEKTNLSKVIGGGVGTESVEMVSVVEVSISLVQRQEINFIGLFWVWLKCK